LSRETALRLVAAMAEQLGVEIDVEEELKKAQAELAAKGGNNLDGLKLTQFAPRETCTQATPPETELPAAA
jgi:hypothetical protein